MASSRDRLKQATRSRVLEVADQLFQERGFAGTTVRDIAEVAGVSAGTVMAVGDKNALLVSVFDAMIAAEHDRRAERSGNDRSGGRYLRRSGGGAGPTIRPAVHRAA